MSISTENFVKHIYLLADTEGDKLSSSELASRMNISRAAVTDMLRKLHERGLVNYKKYSIPTLTGEGRQKALSIIRKHRIWETFLYKTLEMPWENVHREAEDLEHYSSDYLIDHIDRLMGYPSFDPHGDPIPDSKGNIPTRNEQMLLAKVGQAGYYQITRVIDSSEELLSFMAQCGLNPEDEFYLPHWQGEKPQTLVFRNNEYPIPNSILNFLYVKPNKQQL